MTQYLITGGAGFIGSNLAEMLIKNGHSVTVVDNFSSGVKTNLAKLEVKLIEGSILDCKLMTNLIEQTDHVLHLAAVLGVFNILERPLESLKTNLQGTEIVLEIANKFKKPVLITSTSEIYGKNTKIPLNEEDDRVLGSPLKSRWSYSESKALDESMAYFFYQEYGLPVRIVRLFNTVGPKQVGQYGMVLPRFIDSAIKCTPLKVYGDGSQIRCFCHVDDVVSGLLKIIDSEVSIGQAFNLGNNEQTTILNLAKRVIEITQSESDIEFVPYEKAYGEGFEDMQRRVPDISKITTMLGWKPRINLNQIIHDVYSSKNI